MTKMKRPFGDRARERIFNAAKGEPPAEVEILPEDDIGPVIVAAIKMLGGNVTWGGGLEVEESTRRLVPAATHSPRFKGIHVEALMVTAAHVYMNYRLKLGGTTREDAQAVFDGIRQSAEASGMKQQGELVVRKIISAVDDILEGHLGMRLM